MAALGIRRSAWQAQSDRDKTIIKYLASGVLELGQPARFTAPGGPLRVPESR